MAVERQSAFKAQGVPGAQAGGNGNAGGEQGVPNGLAHLDVDVDLETVFAGVARAGNDCSLAQNFRLYEGVVLHLLEVVFADGLQRFRGSGALKVEFRDLAGGFVKLGVRGKVRADPLGVVLARSGVHHHHELLIAETVGDKVVLSSALLVQKEAVAAAADG